MGASVKAGGAYSPKAGVYVKVAGAYALASGAGVAAAVVQASLPSEVLVTFTEPMNTALAVQPIYNSIPSRKVTGATWVDSTHAKLALNAPVLPGEALNIKVGAFATAAGAVMSISPAAVTNNLAAPGQVAPVTSTAIVLGSQISYGLTAGWTVPAAEDCCIAFVGAGFSTGSSGRYRHALSTGVRGDPNTINMYTPHISAAGTGTLECSLRASSGAAVTIRTTHPISDGVTRVYVLQRVGATGVWTLKSCNLMSGTVVNHGTATLAGDFNFVGGPAVGMSQALTTGEAWGGMMREFGKGRFTLTDAEIIQLASGTAMAALVGRTWAVQTRYDDRNNLVDTTGANPATVSATVTSTADGPVYGPVLTMLEPQDKTVLQRPVSGTRPVTIKGYWPGPASIIQVRLITYETGATVTNWVDATVSLTGYFEATIQGAATTAWLITEVRPKNYPALVQRIYNRVGIGVVVLAIGPSNVYGLFSKLGGQPLAHDLCSYYQPEDCNWTTPPGVGARTYMNGLRTATGLPVAMIRACQSGTGLSKDEGAGRWGTRGQYDPYSWAVANKDQWGGDAECILTQTGGQDARQFGNYADHYADHNALYNDLRAEFGRLAVNMPWLATTLCRYEVIQNAGMNQRYDEIRRAQQDWLDNTPGTLQAGCSVDIRVPLDSGLHFDSAQQLQQAQRLLHSHLFFLGLGGVANTARGPQMVSAVRSGAVIDITVVQNGGAGLRTRSGAIATTIDVALQADTVYASKLPISTITYPDATTIRVALASDPGAGVRLRHQFGQMPGGVTVASDTTNSIYDDRTIQGDTQGAPVLPTTADLLAA